MDFDRDKQRKAGATYSIAMNVFVLLFGIFWCVVVIRMGAGFMALFGLFFVGMAAYRLAMCIKLANSEKDKKNRQSSADPWDRPADRQSHQPQQDRQAPPTGSGYCPYCGSATSSGFQYCPTCGRKLPE